MSFGNTGPKRAVKGASSRSVEQGSSRKTPESEAIRAGCLSSGGRSRDAATDVVESTHVDSGRGYAG
jgi:hypothetical protein